MKLTPKYFCEKYKGDVERSCGNGLALSLANNHPTYSYNQNLNLTFTRISQKRKHIL